jgi:hypothetical protein
MTQILQLMLVDGNGAAVEGVAPFVFGSTQTIHALPFTDDDLLDSQAADWEY